MRCKVTFCQIRLSSILYDKGNRARKSGEIYIFFHLLDQQTPDYVPEIFVKTHSGKTVITIEIEPERTVQALKREIRDETSIPTNKQHITFDDNELEDDCTLHSYGIGAGSVLYMRPEEGDSLSTIKGKQWSFTQDNTLLEATLLSVYM